MTAVDALLKPRSVAIVGATEASRQGRATYDNLRLQGFTGSIWPVNPRYDTLFGQRCYPSVLALPSPPDVVVSAIGAGRSVEVLAESARAGARGAVIFADGFLESGPDGAQRQARVREIAEGAGLAVCGPNCMGLIDVTASLPLWMGTLNRPVPRGEIAVVAQSGTVAIALLNNERGLRFSHVISSGNEAVTSSAAFLQYLVDDPAVSILVNHLETLNEPRRYLRALERAVELGKPVVVLKSGRSEQAGRVIAGHTGQVAGADTVARAVLREHGAILVETLDELVETVHLLSQPRRPRGRRFGFVSISGGYSGLTADLAAQAGLACPPTVENGPSSLPNFVDAWGNGDMAHLPQVLDAFAQSPSVDSVAVVFHLSADPVTGSPEFGRFMTRSVADTAARHPKPMVWITPSARSSDPVAMQTLAEAGVPCLLGLRDGIAALANVTGGRTSPPGPLSGAEKGRGGGLELPYEQPGAVADGAPDSPSPAHGGGGRGEGAPLLTERRSKDWLEARGIVVPRRVLVRSEDEAATAARSVGTPVVLKKQVRGVEHKAGRGYVRLGIGDEHAAREAYRELMVLDDDLPADAVEGVLVEEQIAGALELMVSLTADASFGPVVYLGFGGLASELSPKRAIRLAPVDADGARGMLDNLGLTPLLRRVWGDRSGRVAESIAEAVAGVSRLASADDGDAPTLVEINPLMVTLDGRRAVAADALVQLPAERTLGALVMFARVRREIRPVCPSLRLMYCPGRHDFLSLSRTGCEEAP
jgi:acyl-CoA synthetase (NDP forming)